MPRIDVWDIQSVNDRQPIDCGFPRDLESKYDWDRELGKGGFGTVRLVKSRTNKRLYACKSISKFLSVPNLSCEKQAAHLDNIKREIAILRRLQGILNVAQLQAAYEDDKDVHIVMEYCSGGELWHRIGKIHYSEKTVASYMRATLRTLLQCHARKILHRDIKPGNFMLLDESETAPLKAIDFGLAVFFDPEQLPRTDLGLEGTAWFMAPEVLSSTVGPPADVWAAGVMAYQLLCGFLPFDDRRNPDAPSLSLIWKAILTEEPSFSRPAWQDISSEGKDFVRALLNKDPEKRPTAKQALEHPWLAAGSTADRGKGPPLHRTVVQRIQRYAEGSVLKRTIFELIAQELLKMAPPTPDGSSHSISQASNDGGIGGGAACAEEAGTPPNSMAAHVLSNMRKRKSQLALALLSQGPGGGAIEGPPLMDRNHHSTHAGLEYFKARGESVHGAKEFLTAEGSKRPQSVHNSGSYWRVMRAAATALKWSSESVKGQNAYLRYVGRDEEERCEQRKAARLALDTSAHAGSDFRRFVRQLSSPALYQMGQQHRNGSAAAQPEARSAVLPPPSPSRIPAAGGQGSEEEGGRGQRAYQNFIQQKGGQLGALFEGSGQATGMPVHSQSMEPGSLATMMEVDSAADDGTMTVADQGESSGELTHSPIQTPSHSLAIPSRQGPRSVSFQNPLVRSGGEGSGSGSEGGSRRGMEGGVSTVGSLGVIKMAEMRDLLRRLKFTRDAAGISEADLAEGLRHLGYQLQEEEMALLTRHISSADEIPKATFLASQMDWHTFQEDYREVWLEAAKRVFQDIDGSSSGRFRSGNLLRALRAKLPEPEINYALEDALIELGYADEEEVDFEGFLRILRSESLEGLSGNLDQYESRFPRPASSENLAPPGSAHAEFGVQLEPVKE